MIIVNLDPCESIDGRMTETPLPISVVIRRIGISLIENAEQLTPTDQNLTIRIPIYGEWRNSYSLAEFRRRAGEEFFPTAKLPWIFDSAGFYYNNVTPIHEFEFIFRARTVLEQLVGY